MAKPLPVAAVVLPRESSASVRSRTLSAQAAHLRNAAGVVRHGAVSVRGQGDAQGGEHADGGDADAVEAPVEGFGEGTGGIHNDGGAAGGEVAQQHGGRHNQDGGQGGQDTQGNTADDDGGGAGLGSGQLLSGLIGVRGVILREVADGAAADETAEDGHINAHVPIQNEIGQGRRQDGGQHSGGVSTGTQALQQGFLRGVFLGLHQEGTHDGADNAGDGQRHRQQQSAPAVAAHSAQQRSPEWNQRRTRTGRLPYRPRRPRCRPRCRQWWRGSGDHPPGCPPQPCPPGPRPRRRPWCRCRRPHGQTAP